MKVYVRSDLNMRKGKISSQVSHAVVAMWLNCMKQTEEKFTLSGENYNEYKKWLKDGSKIEILPVPSEEELISYLSYDTVLIEDQGRTEFKGHTKTCVSKLSNVSLYGRLSCSSISDKPAKQTLIANRDLKLNKWVLAEYAATASWNALSSLMEDTGEELVLYLNKEDLKNWLLGAFAKITLKIDEKDINEMKSNLKDNDIGFSEYLLEDQTVVLATTPRFCDVLDAVTSNLKLY